VGHHRVDLVDRDLHHEHADLAVAIEHRCAEERGLVVIGRQVLAEFRQRHHAGLVERPGLAEGIAEA
jgi:hypothetical protein